MFKFLSNKRNALLASAILCMVVAIVKGIKLYTHLGNNNNWQMISTILFIILAIVNFIKYINFKSENV